MAGKFEIVVDFGEEGDAAPKERIQVDGAVDLDGDATPGAEPPLPAILSEDDVKNSHIESVYHLSARYRASASLLPATRP